MALKFQPPDKKNDRKLEERSYLSFEFYESSNSSPIIRILPMYQNPEIEETRRANYVKYQPISRNSTLMSFIGAESRMFNINFHMTYPNVLEYSDLLFERRGTSKYESKEQLKAKFLKPGTQEPVSYQASRGNSQDFDRLYQDLKSDVFTNRDPNRTGSDAFFNKDKDDRPYNKLIEAGDVVDVTARNRTIDLIMYWVNLIRSSALNNAKNPTLGPPIVRLNHGILYQDIPCVCLDYKINMDEAAGVDAKTLLPRIIQITLNLQELRGGNFGDYDIRFITDRDNNVGWEAMIDGTNTIDPVRMDIGTRYRS